MSRAPWTAETRARRAGRPYVPPIIQHFGSKTEYRNAFYRRNDHVENFGMWPERRETHPESLEQTLERVRS